MKILHINTFYEYGGAETIARTLVNSSEKNFFITKSKSTDHKNVLVFNKNVLDYFFELLNKLKWRYRPDYTFKKIFFIDDEFNCTYKKLKRLKHYQEADIIHLHNIHGGYFDLKALPKIATEKKIVWTLHDMWCMTGGEAYTFENDNYIKGIGKTPYLHVTPLCNPIIDRRQHYLDLKKNIYTKTSKNIYFVANSKWLEACLRESYVFNSSMKLRTIYGGYDESIFYRNNRRISTVPRLLVFNSSSPFKGSEIYQTVLDNIRIPFELTIVGADIQLNNINIQKKILLYYTADRTKLAGIFNSTDILIFPSKAEVLGLLPIEAMACGVCVFASNIGGIPEYINHRQTGFLFNTVEELNDLLENNMANLPEINLIGERASEYVKHNFTNKIMLDQYSQLYEEIANQK